MSLEHVSPDDELNSVEAGLRSLVPMHSRLDRDRVMFAAGEASARRSLRERRAWMAVAAGLAIVALGEATLLVARSRPMGAQNVVVRSRIVDLPSPAVAPSAVAVASSGSHEAEKLDSALPGFVQAGLTEQDLLARQLLYFGLDGLPPLPSSVRGGSDFVPERSAKSLREELLKDLGLGERS